MVEIAVMGYGVVGSGVVEVLTNHTENIAKRAKEQIDIKYILDLRDFPESPFESKFTKSFDTILNDPDVKIVVEVMGGLNPSFEYVKRCLEAGKSVVTSNKELVAAKAQSCLKLHRKIISIFYLKQVLAVEFRLSDQSASVLPQTMWWRLPAF